MRLIFVTGNAMKFAVAKTICAKYGFEAEQVVLDIDEIQGEDPEIIIRDKARKAYELVGKPVVVSDDSWSLSAIGGFPGAYMKSINHWFTTQHFLNLMKDETDRTAVLHQFLAYQDNMETVVFGRDLVGQILTEPRGQSDIPIRPILAMDKDDGKSLAEVDALGKLDSPERLGKSRETWDDLLEWLQQKTAN